MCLDGRECDLVIHTTIIYVWGGFFKFRSKFTFAINHPTIVVDMNNISGTTKRPHWYLEVVGILELDNFM